MLVDLLRLELNGQLGWSVTNPSESLEDLQQQLLHLRLRGSCIASRPLTSVTALDGVESPLVSAIARDLQEELGQAIDPVAEQALIESASLCR